MFQNSNSSVARRMLAAVLPVAVAVTFAGVASAEVDTDQQARFAQGLSTVGNAEGIGYSTAVTPDLRTVSATLDDGRFVLGQDGTLTVESATGRPIVQVPTRFGTVGGHTITVTTAISADGRTIMARPQVSQGAAVELKTIVCVPAITAVILYLPCVGLVGLPNALIGALIGAAVGTAAPQIIPQVLP